MTESGWVELGIFVAGLCLQGVGFLIARARDLEAIKQDISERISDEKLERTKALNSAVTDRDVQIEKIRKDWTDKLDDSQEHHDGAYQELGLSLRRHIEGVSLKMHENEIWNRDNFVRKQELDSVRSDIKELAAEMRTLVGNVQVNMQQDFKEAIRDLKSGVAKA
jgi:hypothetical protein